MTYQDIIPRLDYELRDEEAWPSDTSKIKEQLNLLYNAALVIGRSVPLGRLPLAESAALTATQVKGVIDRYDLNEAGIDIFDLRYAPDIGIEDMGIASLRLDGEDYLPSQGISPEGVLNIGGGGIHKDRILFAIDYPNEAIYATNVTALKLYHVKKFTRPKDTTGNADSYDTLDWPLQNDNDTERVIHIVAAHVNGVTIHDPAQAQFQSVLEQAYAG